MRIDQQGSPFPAQGELFWVEVQIVVVQIGLRGVWTQEFANEQRCLRREAEKRPKEKIVRKQGSRVH